MPLFYWILENRKQPYFKKSNNFVKQIYRKLLRLFVGASKALCVCVVHTHLMARPTVEPKERFAVDKGSKADPRSDLAPPYLAWAKALRQSRGNGRIFGCPINGTAENLHRAVAPLDCLRAAEKSTKNGEKSTRKKRARHSRARCYHSSRLNESGVDSKRPSPIPTGVPALSQNLTPFQFHY